MKICLLALTLLLANMAPAQSPAPAAPCDLTRLPAGTPTRIVRGVDPSPFHYACEPKSGCVASQLFPGQIVVLGPQRDGWACVSHNADSGWTPASSLAPIPADPTIPLADWLGAWSKFLEIPARTDDHFDITPGASPGSLHIAGRAFWFGRPGNAHLGGVNAEAAPVGLYVHFVEGANLSGCILDLKFEPATHTISAFDNHRCGGMHVSFSGTWMRPR